MAVKPISGRRIAIEMPNRFLRPKATETDAISEYMEFSDHAEQVSEPGCPPEIKVKRSKAKIFEPIIEQDNDHEAQIYNALE
ncbi:hypothetical protein SAMN05216333_11840 [Nitrosomonas oligotropha]|uniref:Uncharacterized protein n=1 Tax=Nitrosomonas oligotropha TaxID=42354 RepID=A0A1H8SFQ4_9PROT|nr:hypothetical protein SAMN05216300_11940 [Nitrosomonas oligotropha]SEO77128.1 hypothetical protein SAMN05216333_11840 [Nitrosomonas oligotropha]